MPSQNRRLSQDLAFETLMPAPWKRVASRARGNRKIKSVAMTQGAGEIGRPGEASLGTSITTLIRAGRAFSIWSTGRAGIGGGFGAAWRCVRGFHRSMTRFLAMRVVQALITLLVASFIVFALARLKRQPCRYPPIS